MNGRRKPERGDVDRPSDPTPSQSVCQRRWQPSEPLMLVSAHAATAAAQHGVTPAHVGSNATLSTRTSPRATPSLLPLSTVLIAHVCCVGARSTRFSSPHPSHAATMTLPCNVVARYEISCFVTFDRRHAAD